MARIKVCFHTFFANLTKSYKFLPYLRVASEGTSNGVHKHEKRFNPKHCFAFEYNNTNVGLLYAPVLSFILIIHHYEKIDFFSCTASFNQFCL